MNGPPELEVGVAVAGAGGVGVVGAPPGAVDGEPVWGEAVTVTVSDGDDGAGADVDVAELAGEDPAAVLPVVLGSPPPHPARTIVRATRPAARSGFIVPGWQGDDRPARGAIGSVRQ